MNATIARLVGLISAGQDLSSAQIREAISLMMQGACTEEESGLFLTGLATKGETVDELAGAASALRDHMTPIRCRRVGIVDTCGTGGGGSTTFNISTTAAIVAAAAGVPVAKHGNRSITSRSGSADVLAELGVNLDASREQVEACLDQLGLCFCFAPLVHPAMRHVGPVRKKLGIRTIFNLLGPLANPAGASFQLLGVGQPAWRPLIAAAIGQLGTKRTLVVSGEGGLGDVSCSGTTHVSEVTPHGVREYCWTPEDFGLPTSPINTLAIDSPSESAALIRRLLEGATGAPRDIVVMNAAAALLAAGASPDPLSAADKAAAAIDSGAARDLLGKLAALSHAPA